MAWPFGRKSDRKEVEDDLTDERLRMMANVAIEQVPLPEEGIMTEEDAWTISPGPARVGHGWLFLVRCRNMRHQHQQRPLFRIWTHPRSSD